MSKSGGNGLCEGNKLNCVTNKLLNDVTAQYRGGEKVWLSLTLHPGMAPIIGKPTDCFRMQRSQKCIYKEQTHPL